MPRSPALKKTAGTAFGRHRLHSVAAFLGADAASRACDADMTAPRPGVISIEQEPERGKCMKALLASLLVGGSVIATSGVVLAHHSFAMFDQEHPIQLVGTVKEFRYTSPHTFIILDVKDKDGTSQLWNLEGGAPSGLIRDGWTSKTLKPGDELQLSVDPLRSGAPGGAWNVNKIKYKDGKPIVVTH